MNVFSLSTGLTVSEQMIPFHLIVEICTGLISSVIPYLNFLYCAWMNTNYELLNHIYSIKLYIKFKDLRDWEEQMKWRRVRHMAPQITAQSHRWHLNWDLQVISRSGESLAYETCPFYVFTQFTWHPPGSCAPLIHRSWVWLLWAIPELSASCSKHPIDEHSHYRSALF